MARTSRPWSYNGSKSSWTIATGLPADRRAAALTASRYESRSARARGHVLGGDWILESPLTYLNVIHSRTPFGGRSMYRGVKSYNLGESWMYPWPI